jgi:hypothetical protein
LVVLTVWVWTVENTKWPLLSVFVLGDGLFVYRVVWSRMPVRRTPLLVMLYLHAVLVLAAFVEESVLLGALGGLGVVASAALLIWWPRPPDDSHVSSSNT